MSNGDSCSSPEWTYGGSKVHPVLVSHAPVESTPSQPGSYAEKDVVFNITWTGDVYHHLRYFLGSLLAHTDARFRYLANSCSPESVRAMKEFAARNPDRVIEVMEVSPEGTMIAHGTAIDMVLRERDDGPFLAFIDCDIKARGPFLSEFLTGLEEADAITSGKEVWIDSNVQPADHPGVDGQYFFRSDGFVYGSPHMAIYHRQPLIDALDRFGVDFSVSGMRKMPESTWDHLVEQGFKMLAFDTGKVANILLQSNGSSLIHREHENLVHIGGLSHYLAPPEWDKHESPTGEPTWTTWKGMTPRSQVARYAADAMRAVLAGESAPDLPPDLDASMRAKLELVRDEVVDMIRNPGPV